jgi:hypothetical protein
MSRDDAYVQGMADGLAEAAGTNPDMADALAGFADSNRALFAEYVRGWYEPDRAAAILADWRD